MKELHLTEGRNTGFKKILDALESNGSPKPEFETDEDRSYFITRFFIHEGFLEDELLQKDDDINRTVDNEFVDTTRNAINGSINFDAFSKNEKLVYKAIKENLYITRLEMVAHLGISIRGVDRAIKSLKDKGIIERMGSNKTGYWKVIDE